MLYIITVAVSAVLITLANFFAGRTYTAGALGKYALLTLLCIAAVFVIDGFFAFIIRRLPEKWFAPEARLFTVGKRERNFYRRTRIDKWKKYVPEWGCFTGFHKDKMREPDNSEYIGRFLLESNYGVAGHVAGALFGFGIMLIPIVPALSVALPVASVNCLLSLLPTAILRSNTPALRGLYKRARAKEETKIQNEKRKVIK